MSDLLDRIVAFSGADDLPVGRATFEQTGEMWQTPGARPMAYTASQWMDADRPAFSWRARFPMAPGVALHVEDAFDGEHGWLVGKLWGWLPVMRQAGPEVDRGELARYLAEIPWNPAAYRHCPGITWEAVGAHVLRARWGDDGLYVDLHADADGRITRVSCPNRPRGVGKTFVETPWVGRFDRWERVGSVMIPTVGEVAWELPEGEHVYWRGRIVAHRVG